MSICGEGMTQLQAIGRCTLGQGAGEETAEKGTADEVAA
jgi:hypothetical protein